ncbi:MAG TPA: aldehyde dehydrogenase (NADP(+)) [Polyangiaceae bacterium]|nr:aldehyde dehydrogenase (NADP(+)) [Polyangiaceae bacterium]
MTITGSQIIGSQSSRESPSEFFAVAPATGQRLEPAFAEASAAEAAAALELADRAAPELYGASGRARAELLEAIAEQIMALGDALIERASAETALPAARLSGERARTVGQLRLLASYAREGSWVNARIDRADPKRQPLPKPDVRSMLRPLGPVVVFSASNFPLAFSVAGGDTASALAAGCPVIVKAHPAHPGTSELVGHAVQRALAGSKLPEGTFSMLQGASNELGRLLVQHPLTRAVAFTGSLAGGRALFDAAQRRPEPISVFAEMGSVNPVVVLPFALARRAAAIAEGLYQSLTAGVGQFCTNPGLVLVVQSGETRAFIDLLAERVRKTPAGTMLAPRIAQGYGAGLGRNSGLSGVQVAAQGEPATAACGAVTTLLTTSGATFLATPDLEHELFGPCTLVVECASHAELEQVVERLKGQLTATLHAEPDEIAEHGRLFQLLERRVGRVIVDGFPTGVEVCHAMQHGGPYPATTDPRFTSVGSNAVLRFVRPVCLQNVPELRLPDELKSHNPCGILRLVDGVSTRDPC